MADAEKGRALLDKLAADVPSVVAPMELLGRLKALWKAGLPPGDRTGWPSLDQHYTVVPGQFSVVTGWPSSGKSEWLDALLIHLARQGWCFSMFSPENQPTELHASKMLEKLSGKPFGRGPTERMSEGDLEDTTELLDRSFRFLEAPESGTLSVKAVIEAASPWLLKQEKRGLVMDPWNELEHWRPAGLTETEYVSQTLSYVRNWARKNQVHVWIVAHPQKMREKDGKLPVPRPDMISGSQNWWNKADCAITVWRDLEALTPGEVAIYVQKIRFKHVGSVGVVNLRWDKPTGRYFEVPSLRAVQSYRNKGGDDE